MATPLKTHIATSMRSMILTGQIEPGSRMKEEEIAARYSVSRAPIRDVFIELSKEGLMRQSPYKGLTVRKLPTEAARRIYVRTRRDIEDLALKEGFACWREQDWRELDKVLIGMRIASEMEDLQEFVIHDMGFHRFLIERIEGDNLIPVWTPLISTMALPYSRHKCLKESYQEHLAIVEALRECDLNGARKLLKQHIR
jgi:DNA-binding GntR family transcriptional regulator